MDTTSQQVVAAGTGLDRSQARIAAIEPMLVRVGIRNQLLVKVTTEDGLFGWGESGLSSREASVIAMLNDFARFLIGQDSRRIGRIWQECYRGQYFEGGRVITAAISALDIALHDLLGKRLDVPVYQLLGGKQRDTVGSFATTMGTSIDRQIEDIRILRKEGWQCVRTYPGSFGEGEVYDPQAAVSQTATELIAIREEFGPDLCLGVDLHHRLSVVEAANFCARLPVGTLDFLEEPIRSESPEAYRMLRSMTSVPFAVGEEFASKWQAAPFIEQGLTQYMRLDICNIGGFTEAMKVAGWCERHYMDLMPHNPLGPVCTAASVNMSAAVPNFSWLETRQSSVESNGFHDEKLFPVQVRMDGPNYVLPDCPGLGVEIDEDAIASQAVTHVECPHLRRTDGSVTNW
ncbi:mandelate racemase/muconate lactonizing enzyme family protein [Paracoccus sp. Z330]|uniref:Mandelate racemase/muconate lactonizing enzyme family protein n=1 Tax=Paracoccus onchidii TaxID=3017813 RepID=A0ABT4ZD46_9RHOB|nr:mandelate racemase/muconate lactonizing enzyme family protein [Paracoccus onchidii]MDB6177284.1 mandelate racemase/muconate lactonizing enzyme family protein [Paracoccus onchidii]